MKGLSPAVPSLPATGRGAWARVFRLGGGALWMTSAVFAARGQAPFDMWFFCIAGWSYILLVDGWVYLRKGESLILSYPARFAGVAAWSVLFWALFEAANFRLLQWRTEGLPAEISARWAVYALSFSTVVPALLETSDWFDSTTRGSLSLPPRWGSGRALMVGAGVAALVLPWLWPTVFYPLIWAAPFFLLDPLNDRCGGPSLLSDWKTGSLRRWVPLLASGWVCGWVWQAGHLLSSVRWVSTSRVVDPWKVLDMPAGGVLAFCPLALSAFAATATVVRVWENRGWLGRALLVVAATVSTGMVFWGMDRWTALK